ncbi:hypothetical protein FQN50_004438 [Emmonsiellopsis sp. PD_5]|nr:hypothetical protein FQN50_004438 [Emmonsiellopsis sp. PD_5]
MASARMVSWFSRKAKATPEDWNGNEDFFRFTRGRFVYDGEQQLAQQTRRFNMNALAEIAAKATGAGHCIKVEKCPDGMYNRAFILTMDNGMQVVGKVPNPNAGIPHYTTASEVATLEFVRTVLQTPVPRVYAWNSQLNEQNPVGAEYIIMGKIPGIPLSHVWDFLDPPDQLKVFLQVFKMQKRWTGTRFLKFGALYYAESIATTTSTSGPVSSVVPAKCVYINENGERVDDARFAIGPAVGREWVEDGRQGVQCDRGPWSSMLDYLTAVGLKEKAAIETLQSIPKQMVIVYGPNGLYQPTLAKKLSAVDYYLHTVKDLMPKDADAKLVSGGHLWHNDLHCENILVNPEKPTEILGIIDWQSVQISPLFQNQIDPSFLDYDGPELKDDDLTPPELEDTSSLDAAGQALAIRTFYKKSVMVAWRMLVQEKDPAQYAAIRFRRSLRGHLLNLGKSTFTLGEPHSRALFLDLKTEEPAFPLVFSETEKTEIERDALAVHQGTELMKDIADRLTERDLWPEKGLIESENYEAVMSELRTIKGELMAEFVKSEVDRKIFEDLWIFDC